MKKKECCLEYNFDKSYIIHVIYTVQSFVTVPCIFPSLFFWEWMLSTCVECMRGLQGVKLLQAGLHEAGAATHDRHCLRLPV